MTQARIRWRWHAVRLPALVAAVLVTLLEFTSPIGVLDRVFRDQLLRMESRAPHPDIVLVTIDDTSLAALGRWPWSSSRHAELITQLTASNVRVIGLDLPLAESETPEQDAPLALAMAASGRVVLPMQVPLADGGLAPLLPAPALRSPALAVGHTHLPRDNDNLVRRVFLLEGQGDLHWSSLALGLYRQGRTSDVSPTTPWSPPDDRQVWHRQNPIEIAYAGPAGHFPRLSYSDVLHGHVPTEMLRGKYVLVGISASGLKDPFVTPLSLPGAPTTSVEIHANVLDSLLSHRVLRVASPANGWFFNLAMLAIMVLVMLTWRLGPAGWLGLFVILTIVAVGAAALAQRLLGVQLSPMPGLLAMAAIGLLYWWQQWRQRTHYLTHELLRFRGSHEQIEGRSSLKGLLGDPMGHRIRSLRELMQQLRDVHRFVRDSLDALPDATLVCDVNGRIELANTAAAALARQLGHLPASASSGDRRSRPGDALGGQQLLTLLRLLDFPDGHADQLVHHLLEQPATPGSAPATSAQGRDYLIKCVPTHGTQARHAGWVVSIVDVTDIHEAQRQRDQAIGFLSHDMRAPQSAILSLLELRRTRPELLPPEQFEERVERHARKALSMSDGFIQLARAQSRDYRLQPLNLVDLVREAMDDLWETAQSRRIVLHYADGPPEATAEADRELLGRAVTNLLGNAIKFSPANTAVEAAVRAEPGHWVVSVNDVGPGIAPEALADLFKPFFRDPTSHRVDGAGLGLPFVHAVMTRHGGKVTVQSQRGAGSCFELWVPIGHSSP